MGTVFFSCFVLYFLAFNVLKNVKVNHEASVFCNKTFFNKAGVLYTPPSNYHMSSKSIPRAGNTDRSIRLLLWADESHLQINPSLLFL